MSLGPLQVGVADIRRHLGSRRPLAVRAPLDGLAISTSAVPPGALVEVDLELESISNGVVAEGLVRAPWVAECRRCLDPIEGVVESEVREIFERRPVDGETYPLGDDDVVDLEPMVRDAVLLSLPIAPLCGPECRGPAPETFPAAIEGEEPPEGEPHAPDPRWAALDQLRFESDDPGARN
jgi:uncharacterized protein